MTNLKIWRALNFFRDQERRRRQLTQQNNNNNNVHDDSRDLIAEQNAAFEESLRQDREKVIRGPELEVNI